MKYLLRFLLLLLPFIASAHAAETHCDPFTVKCRQSGPALTKYALSQLEMVGTITQEGEMFAIIKTPDNHVYPGPEGNFVGIEGGRVAQVTSDQTVIEGQTTETLWLQQAG
jgi:Tfp pilus assembly protein PilP